MTQGPADPYGSIAIWYDLEHDPLTEDIEAYLSLLTVPPSGRAAVLEVGSGTGRVAAALAVAGHEITGIEPSAAMRGRSTERLAHLPPRVARRVHVLAGSATDLGIVRDVSFDAVLFTLNVMAHLTSDAERSEALRIAHSHLRPGGQLIVDLDLQGPRRLLELARQVWWQGTWVVPETPDEVSHFVTAAPGSPGTLDITHFYDQHTPGGQVRRQIARMALALLSHGEVALAIQHAGFAIEATYGTYDLAPYDDLSPRAIFDARRAL